VPLAILLVVLATDGGTPVIVGSLAGDQLDRVVHDADGAVSACQGDAGVRAGALTARFTIGPSGAVSESAITDSTLHDARFESCLQRVVAKLKFPAPKDGGVVHVSYPFVFASPAPEPAIGDVGTRGDGKYGQGGLPNDEPVVMGGLTREQVKQVVRQHRADVLACTSGHGADGGPPPGTVAIKALVSATGAVTTSRVTATSTGNPALDECVRALTSRMVFPRPSGASSVAVVTIPFRFER
jgi:TonB family protein